MPKESNSLIIPPATLTFNHQKRKRPSNLQLNLHSKRPTLQLNHIAPREQYVKQSFNQSPQTLLQTPEFKENLALMSPNTINKSIANTNQSLFQGQNGKTNLVHFKNQEHQTRSLVEKSEKSGRFSIAYEIQINKTIKKKIDNNLLHLFSLPVHEQLDSFYTLYREAGTLEINCKNIKEKLENKYTLSYLFQGFSQMITALSFLHNSKFTDEEGNDHIGIIHNDIKPDNILLKKTGFELADFGCAYYKDKPAPQFATYFYTAPEIWNKPEFCHEKIENMDKADIWSLGATLMYVLTEKIIPPSEKADCEFNQLLSYQQWAENYIEQWKTLLHHQSITDNIDLQGIANKLKNIIHELGEKTKHPQATIFQKKKLLEYIALLMLAPIHVRPDAKELENIMKNISFVIHEESEIFYSQHLRKNNNYFPTLFRLQSNDYVVVSESTMNMKISQ
ncbi:protein kinase domain-containing protein [Rickettsiella endosymbiont of Rhagonycha lignosa]|uniref:protein kinase domain-containing protein n=1 Tax=Rickettsiella endosymbiont of Rhagonycha lignosa TaxID=3077937 RepID=UPI00313E740D